MKQKYSGKAEEPIMIMSESVTEQGLSQSPLFTMGLASSLGNHFINEDEGFVNPPLGIPRSSSNTLPVQGDEVQQTQNPTEKFNSMAERFKSLTKTLKMNINLPKKNNSNFLFGTQFPEKTFLEEQSENGLVLQKIRESEILKTGINVLSFNNPENFDNISPFESGIQENRKVDYEDRISQKKLKKTKRGGKQYAMRKGTIKMIDELKNFEGFSKMVNAMELTKQGEMAPKGEKTQIKNCPQKQEMSCKQVPSVGLKLIHQQKKAELLKNQKIQLDKILEKNRKNKGEESETSDSENEDPFIKKNLLGGDLNTSQIEESIEYDEDEQRKLNLANSEYEGSMEGEPLMKPEIYNKICRSKLFNPNNPTRDYNLSDYEMEEDSFNKNLTKNNSFIHSNAAITMADSFFRCEMRGLVIRKTFKQ